MPLPSNLSFAYSINCNTHSIIEIQASTSIWTFLSINRNTAVGHACHLVATLINVIGVKGTVQQKIYSYIKTIGYLEVKYFKFGCKDTDSFNYSTILQSCLPIAILQYLARFIFVAFL